MKFAAPFFIAAGLLANLAIAQSGKTPYVPGRGSSGSNGNGNGQGYTPYSQWNSPAGSRASGSSSLPSYESRPPYSPPATDPGYDLTCGSITMLCGPGGADCRCSATGVTTCYSEDHPSFIQCNQLCSCRRMFARFISDRDLVLTIYSQTNSSCGSAWTI